MAAKYVVGCDGANSITRRSINSQLINFGFNERWLVVDVILKNDKAELGDYTIQYCDPARPHTYVRCPGKRRRWEISVRDNDDADTLLDDDTIWRFLSTYISPNEADIERKAIYTFQSAMAEKWCKGHILIAGDAAHLTPPFMGQGMCGGIRDVANLAWKLISCLQLGHSDQLLASYQQERAPHMEAYIKTAMKLGGLINTCDTERALQGALTQSDGTSVMHSLDRALGEGLAAGDANHAGTLFPQPQLTDDRWMDTVVGYAPALIISEKLFSDLQTLKPGWTTSESAPTIIQSAAHPMAQAWLDDNQTCAVVIRPDRYVLGTANTRNELLELIEFHDRLWRT